MDLDIIITSAVIVAACILPMIFLSRKQKQKKARLKNTLSEIARANSTEIDSHEFCGHVGIGMTTNNEGFVFYNKHEDGREDKHFILLREVKQCTTVSTSRGSGNVGKLILNFAFIDKAKPDLDLHFFDSSETFQLAGELQLLEKWKPTLDSSIAAKRVERNAANNPKEGKSALV